MSVRLIDTYAKQFISANEYDYMQAQVTAVHNVLTEKSGAGNAFLGWMDLPRDYDKYIAHAHIVQI